MKQLWFRALAVLISALVCINVLTVGADSKAADTSGETTADFVERGYSLMLSRESDPEGLKFWVDQLNSGAINAAEMITGFYESPEFQGKKYGKSKSVETLYKVMLSRDPDEDGLGYWVGLVDKGFTHRYIINGFSASPEFNNLCAQYGINAGNVNFTEVRDANSNVTEFVNDCYNNILGRKPDIPGLDNWVLKFLSGEVYPEDMIYGFVYSAEAKNVITTDRDFVTALYRSFFGHEADEQGMSFWLNYLASHSRDELFNEFKLSPEFAALLAAHNMTLRPTPTPTPSPTPVPYSGMVALTFDDGPYSPVTNVILDELEKVGGHATFFVVGDRCATYSSCLTRAVGLGCEIGNHTYDHKSNLANVSGDTIRWEIGACNDAVHDITGIYPTVMRPCGGSYSDTTRANCVLPMIIWSLDTQDWRYRNTQKTIDAILNNVKDGDVILMHDLYESTGEAMKTVIPELTNRGYKLVTVSELAEAKGITLEAGAPYYSIR